MIRYGFADAESTVAKDPSASKAEIGKSASSDIVAVVASRSPYTTVWLARQDGSNRLNG